MNNYIGYKLRAGFTSSTFGLSQEVVLYLVYNLGWMRLASIQLICMQLKSYVNMILICHSFPCASKFGVILIFSVTLFRSKMSLQSWYWIGQSCLSWFLEWMVVAWLSRGSNVVAFGSFFVCMVLIHTYLESWQSWSFYEVLSWLLKYIVVFDFLNDMDFQFCEVI